MDIFIFLYMPDPRYQPAMHYEPVLHFSPDANHPSRIVANCWAMTIFFIVGFESDKWCIFEVIRI